MSHNSHKKPLYRKVNTRAHGVHHWIGGDYRHERNTKAASDWTNKGTMHGRKRRGLDYTPLFMFLLSKVGSDWDSIYSEAVARLDRPDPIWWLVALHEEKRREIVCVGESSFYSGLFVDDAGILQIVNPDLRPENLKIHCTCCTHTFNGIRFPQV